MREKVKDTKPDMGIQLIKEARRLQEDWHDSLSNISTEFTEKASATIDALASLVVAAYSPVPSMPQSPEAAMPHEVSSRTFEFGGEGKCPDFIIKTKGCKGNVVVKSNGWLFDSKEHVNEEIVREIAKGLDGFFGEEVDEKTVCVIASCVRINLFRLIRERRIEPVRKGEDESKKKTVEKCDYRGALAECHSLYCPVHGSSREKREKR